jgi:hypothetical protein
VVGARLLERRAHDGYRGVQVAEHELGGEPRDAVAGARRRRRGARPGARPSSPIA